MKGKSQLSQKTIKTTLRGSTEQVEKLWDKFISVQTYSQSESDDSYMLMVRLVREAMTPLAHLWPGSHHPVVSQAAGYHLIADCPQLSRCMTQASSPTLSVSHSCTSFLVEQERHPSGVLLLVRDKKKLCRGQMEFYSLFLFYICQIQRRPYSSTYSNTIRAPRTLECVFPSKIAAVCCHLVAKFSICSPGIKATFFKGPARTRNLSQSTTQMRSKKCPCSVGVCSYRAQ